MKPRVFSFQASRPQLSEDEVARFQRELRAVGSGDPGAPRGHRVRVAISISVLASLILLGGLWFSPAGRYDLSLVGVARLAWVLACIAGVLAACAALPLLALRLVQRLRTPRPKEYARVAVRVGDGRVSVGANEVPEWSLPARSIAHVGTDGALVRVATHDGEEVIVARLESEASAQTCARVIEEEVERETAQAGYRRS